MLKYTIRVQLLNHCSDLDLIAHGFFMSVISVTCENRIWDIT